MSERLSVLRKEHTRWVQCWNEFDDWLRWMEFVRERKRGNEANESINEKKWNIENDVEKWF